MIIRYAFHFTIYGSIIAFKEITFHHDHVNLK